MIKKVIEYGNRLYRALARDKGAGSRVDLELQKFNLDGHVLTQAVRPSPDYSMVSVTKGGAGAAPLADDDSPLAVGATIHESQMFNFEGYTEVTAYFTHDPAPVLPASVNADVELWKFNPTTQQFYLSKLFANVANNAEITLDVKGARCYLRFLNINVNTNILTLHMAPQ